MLAPEVVSAYVREYHRDFARASAALGRDRGRIERKLDEAERRKSRLLRAFSDGGSEFDEIRDLLTNAGDEEAGINREPATMDALHTVLAPHPPLEEVTRTQGEDIGTEGAAGR